MSPKQLSARDDSGAFVDAQLDYIPFGESLQQLYDCGRAVVGPRGVRVGRCQLGDLNVSPVRVETGWDSSLQSVEKLSLDFSS